MSIGLAKAFLPLDSGYQEDFQGESEDNFEEQFGQRYGLSKNRADRRQYLQEQEFPKMLRARAQHLWTGSERLRAGLNSVG